MRKLLLILVLLIPTFCLGTVRYIAQTAGTFSGGSACNGQTAVTPATWNSTVLSPGDLSYVCGTITGAAGSNVLTVAYSGTSANPITILFDQGAIITAPTYTTTSTAGAAIYSTISLSYVVVDGGSNGLVTSTANGTTLTYQGNNNGVLFAGGCTHCTIKNLTVSNIYQNNGSGSGATDAAGVNTSCLQIGAPATSSTIENNTVSTCSVGVLVSADGATNDASNVTISGNSISDAHWMVNVGGGNSGDTISNLVINGNTMTNWTNWQFPTSAYHTDGIIIYNEATGTATMTASIYNNYIYGNLGSGSPTAFVYCANNTSCTIYNNKLVNTGAVINGLMWLNDQQCSYQVYNNTVVGNTANNDWGVTFGTGPCNTGGLSGVKAIFKNNIFTGLYGGIETYETTMTFDTGISNNNIWYQSGTSSPQFAYNIGGSGVFDSFATWQGLGYDAASIGGTSPNLNASYKPQAGSPALNLGVNLTSLGLIPLDSDFAGNSRPASGSWDAGAYQVSTPPPPPPGSSIGMVINGSRSVTGQLNTAILNNIYYPAMCAQSPVPSWCSGSDIGAWINAAYAVCPATSCRIHVTSGVYTWTTPIVFGTAGDCPVIDGDSRISTQLTWSGSTSATTVTWNCLSYPSGGGISPGFGMRDIRLVNGGIAGTTVGVLLGGSNGAAGWYGMNLDVIGFNVNHTFGNNTWNTTCVQCDFDLPGTSNLTLPSTLTNSGESIKFIGTTFANSLTGNSAYKANCIDNSIGALLTFVGGSMDNCQFVQDTATGGNTVFLGVNQENPSATNNTNSFGTVSAGTVEVYGGVLSQDASTGTVPTAFWSVSGGSLTITGGWADNYNATQMYRVSVSGSGNLALSKVISNGGNIQSFPYTGTTSGIVDISYSGNITTSGNIASGLGSNVVYRCATAGTLPIGALTITAANCGSTADTGIRVK